jgi:hypothetical protein
MFPDRLKTFVRDGKRLRPGEADNGQSTFAKRGGNGCDGVIENHAVKNFMETDGNGKKIKRFGARLASRAFKMARTRPDGK